MLDPNPSENNSAHAQIPLIDQARVFVSNNTDNADALQFAQDMVDVLQSLNCDPKTIAAGQLYPLVSQKPTLSKQVSEHFGTAIYKLISGALQMETIHQANQHANKHTAQQNQIDNLRKMLLAMVSDIRVVLIKLSERLVMLQSSKQDSASSQKKLAKEVMDYYVPLANRLGFGHLKWQLEDWAFRYSNPDDYQKISKALNKRRQDRENTIQVMMSELKTLSQPLQLADFSIAGRAKHIYSIYRKMQRKQIAFEQLFDTSALRIMVPTIDDCYAVLSVVHARWPHIQQEFDDYIAKPKANGYQSIHTAIMKKDGTPVEIQIRTFDMHEKAELGVAAHWKYKENSQQQGTYEEKIAWLREVLDWQKAFDDSSDESKLYQQAFADRTYVFSPNGDVFDLPAGATALDFAYLVHTNVGHRCRGAKINGKLTPLTQPLVTGDRVEIVTGKENQPSRDWMRRENNFLVSKHAIQKVRHWFKQQDISQYIHEGQAIWEKVAKQKSLSKVDLTPTIRHFNFKTQDALFAAIGRGDLQIGNVVHHLVSGDEDHLPSQKISDQPIVKSASQAAPDTQIFDLSQPNGSALLMQLARCCNPIPGDSILGYITKGKGISVHQAHCQNILAALRDRPEKVIEINWKDKADSVYRLQLSILSEDHPGLLLDISNLIRQLNLSILAMNSSVNEKTQMAHILLTLAVQHIDSSKTIIQKLGQVTGVIKVERCQS